MRSGSPDTEAGQAAQPHPPAEAVQAGQIREPVGGSLCKSQCSATQIRAQILGELSVLQ